MLVFVDTHPQTQIGSLHTHTHKNAHKHRHTHALVKTIHAWGQLDTCDQGGRARTSCDTLAGVKLSCALLWRPLLVKPGTGTRPSLALELRWARLREKGQRKDPPGPAPGAQHCCLDFLQPPIQHRRGDFSHKDSPGLFSRPRPTLSYQQALLKCLAWRRDPSLAHLSPEQDLSQPQLWEPPPALLIPSGLFWGTAGHQGPLPAAYWV